MTGRSFRKAVEGGSVGEGQLGDQINREISKRLGISRNTVRQYLRAETVEPAYIIDVRESYQTRSSSANEHPL